MEEKDNKSDDLRNPSTPLHMLLLYGSQQLHHRGNIVRISQDYKVNSVPYCRHS